MLISELEQYLQNGVQLLNIMEMSRSFITGDVAIHFALRNIPHRSHTADVVTINSALYREAVVKEYLKADGFRRVEDNGVNYAEDTMDIGGSLTLRATVKEIGY